MYVQGDSYRTATGKYEKLSCDNVAKLGKIIVSANRNRGTGCRESDSGSLTRGPGSQTLGIPGLGIGSMFNFVRIWSNLDQITALVKANRVDMPKTLRIFVHFYYACVRDPRTKAVFLDRKGQCGVCSLSMQYSAGNGRIRYDSTHIFRTDCLDSIFVKQ
jgi:hypothetical protein